MKSLRVACVAGARPNFVKIAAILRAIDQRPSFARQLIHTGQHFSPEMSDSFFNQLHIPKPDVNLGASGGSQTQQTAEIMKRLEPVLLHSAPDLVLVVGDVNSTVAAALVAVKLGIELVHVEAGLRSFDRSMPEEINRLVTDAISDYLFVSEPSGLENLRREGVNEERVHFCGNVMIDTLLEFREVAKRSPVGKTLGVEPGKYAVATMHRPANVDDEASLRRLMECLCEIGKQVPVVFPIHPRTRAKVEQAGIATGDLILCSPLPYLEFINLVMDARLVLTDSGGIQEETTILRVPCLTLRNNTERPATITHGTNRLVGTDPEKILATVRQALTEGVPPARVPDLWDGRASERILNVLQERLC
jgi:UDP-N-acetylglucosamine 2-epimerase (non-hydrolysing)